MRLKFRPFEHFIRRHIVPKTIQRAQDSLVTYLDVSNNTIDSRVRGAKLYHVHIRFNAWEVVHTSCSCPYEPQGYCKHIVNVLIHADRIINKQEEAEVFQQPSLFDWETPPISPAEHTLAPNTLISDKRIEVHKEIREQHDRQSVCYRLEKYDFLSLSKSDLAQLDSLYPNDFDELSTDILRIEPNSLLVEVKTTFKKTDGEKVQLVQLDNALHMSCSCRNQSDFLCEHIFYALYTLVHRECFLHLAFDHPARLQLLNKHAKKLGVNTLDHLDEFFEVLTFNQKLTIRSKVSLFTPTDIQQKKFIEQVATNLSSFFSDTSMQKETILVVSLPTQQKEKPLLSFHLREVSPKSLGKKKTFAETVQPSEYLKNTENKEEVLFLSALIDSKNRNNISSALYHSIVANPMNFPVYLNRHKTLYEQEKIQLGDLQQVYLRCSEVVLTLVVKQSKKQHYTDFYEVAYRLLLDDVPLSSDSFILSDYFLLTEESIFFIDDLVIMETLRYFQKNKHVLYVYSSLFSSFRSNFIAPIDQHVRVVYDFIPASVEQSDKKVSIQRFIYLSESADYILISPVIAYEDLEVNILSKKLLYGEDDRGNMYAIPRDQHIEDDFLTLIKSQHPSFVCHPNKHVFSLHRTDFLDSSWFLDAFTNWRSHNIEILGFNTLKNNPLSAHKIEVKNSIQSGNNWFDISTEVSFGPHAVRLATIQHALLNKSQFVLLDDGTHGILPEQWIDKFSRYFRMGELSKTGFRIHKSNFDLIDRLFEEQDLANIQGELVNYRKKLADFQQIQTISIPKKLQATLRGYQKEALNWLNFLDEFGFGGCLADDMGLGKTLQIIAYFLLQQEKGNTQTNLVVMPTSLLFNWQNEVEKFAPHLRYISLYGSKRLTNEINFSDYDLIFTTYGTLLSDIDCLRKHPFNVIVLDESQAIKNPSSKRYKAVQLLQGRQRIAVTGTPIENNTFDLYAQMSFAMPGLLGNARQFAINYSTPIDKMQNSERAKELQQKIYPFILRRTKKQVAQELPEKTEITRYCPMEDEQQHLYDSYKLEFKRFVSNLSDEEMKKSSLSILQGLTKLRQICNSTALLANHTGNQSAKITELFRQLYQLKDRHKILIFSQFVGMLNLIEERLISEGISYALLTGQTKDRQSEVDKFQNDASIRIFLISLKAGGTGLNLTQAEYVFLMDPWWNPAAENQAIDRAYRIGQDKQVMAIRLITPNSIEEKIKTLQARKNKLADDLIQTDSLEFKHLSKKDLLNLL